MTLYGPKSFASPAPAFVADSVFDRNGGDAADPNYPEISYAEGLTINGSGHVDSGHGYNYSFNSLGLGDWFSFVNDFPGGPILVPEGYLKVKYLTNATSITKDADILWVYRDGAGGLAFRVSRDASDGGANTLIIEAYDQTAGADWNTSVSWTPTVNTEYEFKWEWKIGTGGYLRLKINDVTIAENLAFEPWIDGASGTQIKTVLLGGWALLGEFWDVEIGTLEETVVVPLINNSTPCCNPVGTSPGAGAAGNILGPPTTAPLTPWTVRCGGGGTYPAGTPVTHSENWTQ